MKKVDSLGSVDSIINENNYKRPPSSESRSYSTDNSRSESRGSRSSSIDLIFTIDDISCNKINVYSKLKNDFKKDVDKKEEKRRKRDQTLERESVSKSPNVNDIFNKYILRQVRWNCE